MIGGNAISTLIPEGLLRERWAKQEEERFTRLGKIINLGKEISAKFPFDEKLGVLSLESIDLETRANHGTYKEYGKLINETCKSKNIPSPYNGEIDWTFRSWRDRVKTVNTLLWLLVNKQNSDKAILEMKRKIGQLQQGWRKIEEELHLSKIKMGELEKSLASKDEQIKNIRQQLKRSPRETNVKAEKGKEHRKIRKDHQRSETKPPRYNSHDRSRKSRGWSLSLDVIVQGKKWPKKNWQTEDREESLEIKHEECNDDSDSMVLLPVREGHNRRKVRSSGRWSPPNLEPCSSEESVESTILSVQEAYKKRLRAIATEHNPDAVEPISKLLQRYPGREHEVYNKVCMELGINPSPQYFVHEGNRDEEESSDAIGILANCEDDESSEGVLVLSDAKGETPGQIISPRSESTVKIRSPSKQASVRSIPWLGEDLLDEQDLDVELSRTWSFAKMAPLKDRKESPTETQFYETHPGLELPKQGHRYRFEV